VNLPAAAAVIAGAGILSGCLAPAVVTEIAAGISGAKAVYDVAGILTTASSDAINAACQQWAVTRAAATARIGDGVVPHAPAAQATDTMPWLDATCSPSAPAPADPIAAAVWLAGLAGRIDQLTKVPAT
jgi:hypothetical protein